jgi:iron-sulfur cluster assembly protein
MSEATIVRPISITPSALSQLKQIRKEQNLDESYGLRVGVKGGGCSGFSYILGFDVQNDKDESYVLDGITILMEKAHGIYLLGMEIDWHEGLDNRGFVFNNPNASDTCGCGTSFSA